jgi:hypothetical protein
MSTIARYKHIGKGHFVMLTENQGKSTLKKIVNPGAMYVRNRRMLIQESDETIDAETCKHFDVFVELLNKSLDGNKS